MLLLAFTATAAAEPAPFEPASNVPMVVLTLLAIVAFIFVLGWLAKRLGATGLVSGRQMRVVSALSLGTRERVALIEVGDKDRGGKQILLGITAQSISLLHTFDTPVIHNGPVDADGVDFASRLKSMLGKSDTPTGGSAGEGASRES